MNRTKLCYHICRLWSHSSVCASFQSFSATVRGDAGVGVPETLNESSGIRKALLSAPASQSSPPLTVFIGINCLSPSQWINRKSIQTCNELLGHTCLVRGTLLHTLCFTLSLLRTLLYEIYTLRNQETRLCVPEIVALYKLLMMLYFLDDAV